MASACDVSESQRRAILSRIAELGFWFHNYEIARGVWTNPSDKEPGIDYPLKRWKLIETLLPDMTGKSCLDVGCSSGFFSVKVKELGAKYVLGVDSGEQAMAIEQAKFAAETLGLDVDFRVMSAYDLATLHRTFDVVLFMGVFYHLRHPLVALEAIRSVCGETMIFQTITTQHTNSFSELDTAKTGKVDLNSSILGDDRFPTLRFVEGTLNNDASCWFVPNIQGVAALLRSCKFRPDRTIFANEYDVIVRCMTE